MLDLNLMLSLSGWHHCNRTNAVDWLETFNPHTDNVFMTDQ